MSSKENSGYMPGGEHQKIVSLLRAYGRHITISVLYSRSLIVRHAVRLRCGSPADKQDQDQDRHDIRQHSKDLRRDRELTAAKHDSERLRKTEQQAREISSVRRPLTEDDSSDRDEALAADRRRHELRHDRKRHRRAAKAREKAGFLRSLLSEIDR